MEILKKLLLTLSISSSLVNAQIASNADPVYFLNNQKYLDFGGVFNLVDQGGNPNTDAFQLSEALSCAVTQLQALNIFPGAVLRTDIYDDSDLPSGMPGIAAQLAQLNVVAPVASVSDEKLTAFMNEMIKYSAPVLAFMGPGTLTTEQPQALDLLFSAPVDSYQSKPLLAIAKKINVMNMALIATSSMNNLYKTFIDDAAKVGITIPCKADNGKTGLADFINCWQQTSVRQVAIFAGDTEVADIIIGLNNATVLTQDTIIFGSNTWAKDANFANLISSGIQSSILLSTFSAVPYTGSLAVLQNCLKTRTSGISPYTGYTQNYQKLMQCTLTTANAFCQAGRNLTVVNDPSCKCRTDENLSSAPITNFGVNYVFDSVLGVANAYANAISKCPDTANILKLSAAETSAFCAAGGKINGTNIADIMRNVTFNGMTGSVRFEGNYRRFAQYDIYQFDGVSNRRVGNWSIPADLTKLMNITVSSTVLSGKSGSVVNSPYFISIAWKDPLALAIAALAALGLIATIITTVFVIAYRENPVIKRSSPLFCAFMLVGIAMLYFNLFMWIGVQTQGQCIAKVWVPLIGFGCLMGPMLAKTFRIWKIFDNSRLRARNIMSSHLLGLSSVVIGVNALILVVWTAVDPLQPTFNSVNIGTCSGNNSAFQTGFFYLFAIYNGILLILGSYLSYKTRSVASAFNESSYIAYTMYNFTLCLVAFVPIYKILGIGSDATINSRTFLIRSLAVLWANTTCLLILFAPKVYHVIKKTEDKGDIPSIQDSAKKEGAKDTIGPSSTFKTSTLVGGTTGVASSHVGTHIGGASQFQSTMSGGTTSIMQASSYYNPSGNNVL